MGRRSRLDAAKAWVGRPGRCRREPALATAAQVRFEQAASHPRRLTWLEAALRFAQRAHFGGTLAAQGEQLVPRLPMIVLTGFRTDLRFRLDVLRMHLPPLRDRLADIVAFAEHLLRLTAPDKRLSSEAAQRMMGHAWPGNGRELRDVMERAAARAKGRNQRAGLRERVPNAAPVHVYGSVR